MPKQCFKCGEIKFLSMFYRHPQTADGHLNKCKECTKLDVREHRKNNDSVREYDRIRAKEKRRSKNHKIRTQIWKKDNPDRVKAHAKLKYAVDCGKIKRMPCEKCGNIKSVGHHDDYKKPLEVRWLCSRCHGSHHAQERLKKI